MPNIALAPRRRDWPAGGGARCEGARCGGLDRKYRARRSRLRACRPARGRSGQTPGRCYPPNVTPSEKSAQKRRRGIRDADDLVGRLTIELEIELGLGPTVAPVGKRLE